MATGLTGLGTRKKSRRLPIIPIFSWLFILLALGLFALELIRFSQELDTLASDVSVGGVEVGGLSAVEAVGRWEQAYAQPITLWYAESPIILDPASVGFSTNQESMLAAARAASENEQTFWSRFLNYLTGQQTAQTFDVELSADYQDRLLDDYLRNIAARYDRAPGTADFDVSTLAIRPGGTGYSLDIDAAKPLVDAALRDPNNREVVLPVSGTNADRPDIVALRNLIVGFLDSQGFIYDGQSTVASVFILDLETGAEVNILSDVSMSAASTIKASILLNYFRYLTFAPSQDEAFLMVQSLLCSNNSSSNFLMEIAGGGDIFEGLADVTNTSQFVGARNTFISAPFDLGDGVVLGSIPAPTISPNADFNTGADPFNQTTAEDLGTLFSMIYDCAMYGSGIMAAFPEGEFTALECRQMLNIMSANDLGRLLQGGIPDGVPIAHKNGWLGNVHGDAGIVFPENGHNYVIAVFVWEDAEFMSFERAWPLIEGISRAAWNYFSPEAPLIAPRTDLPEQARACDGATGFSPPYGEVDLNNINAWRGTGTSINWGARDLSM
jgi:beta-lactamase class A